MPARKQPTRRYRPKDFPVKYHIKGRSGVRPAFVRDEDTGCWNSTAAPTGKGYHGHNGIPAHRDAYERMHGVLADGLECHHMCRNRQCVNPDHIAALSRTDHRKLHRFINQARLSS